MHASGRKSEFCTMAKIEHRGGKEDLEATRLICHEAAVDCEVVRRECESETECTRFRVRVADKTL